MALAVMSLPRRMLGSSFLVLYILLISACALTDIPSPINDASERMCEIEVADGHYPRFKWFQQQFGTKGRRTFVCSMPVKITSVVSRDMEAELEPWCREKIREAMEFSTRCSEKPFSVTSSLIVLESDLEVASFDSSVYSLTGSAHVIEPDS
jgi:hypothetical protein